MNNKKETGDYYRAQIDILRESLKSLLLERVKYGRFRRFVTGIDRNIRKRRKQIKEAEYFSKKYRKMGYTE